MRQWVELLPYCLNPLARKGDAVKGQALGNVGVEDSVSANHLAALVRQHRVGDPMGCREAGQDVGRIVTDAGELDPICLQRFVIVLQLDELRAAVGSPVGAAHKYQQQALGSAEVA